MKFLSKCWKYNVFELNYILMLKSRRKITVIREGEFMIRKYIAVSLLLLHGICALQAMEPSTPEGTPSRISDASVTGVVLMTPQSGVVLNVHERASLAAEIQGEPNWRLDQEEQFAPLQGFVRRIEDNLGYRAEGNLWWRDIIPMVDSVPSGEYPQLTLDAFQEAGSAYIWGACDDGRPFVAVAYTVEYGERRALLEPNSDHIFIQIFFLRNAYARGNWASSGTGMLGRGHGNLTSQDFEILAELIIDGFIKSTAHGAPAILRLAKITSESQMP